jgi:hypothetical protein
MVDDHTLVKISHSGKRISPETQLRLGWYSFSRVWYFFLVW